MFVSDGAKTIIKEARKENFKHNFVKIYFKKLTN